MFRKWGCFAWIGRNNAKPWCNCSPHEAAGSHKSPSNTWRRSRRMWRLWLPRLLSPKDNPPTSRREESLTLSPLQPWTRWTMQLKKSSTRHWKRRKTCRTCSTQCRPICRLVRIYCRTPPYSSQRRRNTTAAVNRRRTPILWPSLHTKQPSTAHRRHLAWGTGFNVRIRLPPFFPSQIPMSSRH